MKKTMKEFTKGQNVYKIVYKRDKAPIVIQCTVNAHIWFTGWDGWYTLKTREGQEIIAPYYEIYETEEEAVKKIKENN